MRARQDSPAGIALAAMLWLGGCVSSSAPNPGTAAAASPPAGVMRGDRAPPSDGELERAVSTLYARDPHLADVRVSVTVDEGIVSLDGAVPSLLAAERLVIDAKQVDGVRALIDRVAVTRAEVPDPELVDRVRRAIARAPVTAPYAIDVQAGDGAVRLSGAVGSWQAVRVAREIAAETPGTRAVEDAIALEPERERPDRQVKAEVESRLADDARVDARLVTVAVRGGTVSLRGSVTDARARALVSDDAWGEGVHAVRDELRFLFEPDPLGTRPPRSVGDVQIQGALLDAFALDARLTGAHPAVSVDAGVVDLEGEVPDGAVRSAAEEDAGNTAGVVEVRDHMRALARDGLGDADVADRVTTALRRELHGWDVRAVVHDGVVTLRGEVSSREARCRAVRAALRVPGVVEVQGEPTLAVAGPGEDDAALCDQVERAMAVSPYLPLALIHTAAASGVVEIEGRVRTPAEATAAVAAAYRAGADHVVRRLRMVGWASAR